MRLSLSTKHRRLLITTGDDTAEDDIPTVVSNVAGSYDPAPEPDIAEAEPEEAAFGFHHEGR